MRACARGAIRTSRSNRPAWKHLRARHSERVGVPETAMQSSVPGITSIVDTLAWRAEHQADRRAFTFLHDDGVSETHLTYGELFARAADIAWELQRRNATGERVLLLYPPGEQ